MHEVLVNRLGGLSLPRKSVVRLIDRPDMTLDVYRGRKTTMQQQQQLYWEIEVNLHFYGCILHFTAQLLSRCETKIGTINSLLPQMTILSTIIP